MIVGVEVGDEEPGSGLGGEEVNKLVGQVLTHYCVFASVERVAGARMTEHAEDVEPEPEPGYDSFLDHGLGDVGKLMGLCVVVEQHSTHRMMICLEERH